MDYNGRWKNWGAKYPDSDSSLEEADDTGDSSDIFHSAKSNLTSNVDKESEYEDLWQSLQKTKISNSNDGNDKQGCTVENIEHADIFANIKPRESSQLSRWLSPLPERTRSDLSSFDCGIDPSGQLFYPAKACPAIHQSVKNHDAKALESKTFFAKSQGFDTKTSPNQNHPYNLEPTAFEIQNQESKEPQTSKYSFDFGLQNIRHHSRPPPCTPSTKQSSPREIIANRFREQLQKMDTLDSGASDSTRETSLFDIHRENESRWITKEKYTLDEKVERGTEPTGCDHVDDDTADSLSLPSLGSSGKGQTRYLQEISKSKNLERINSVISDPGVSRGDQSSTSLPMNAEKCASEVQILKDSWKTVDRSDAGPGAKLVSFEAPILQESKVNDTHGLDPQKNSGNYFSASERDTSKDSWESPVQGICGNGFLKKTENFNGDSEVTKSSVPAKNLVADLAGFDTGYSKSASGDISNDSWERPVRRICGDGFHKGTEIFNSTSNSGNSNTVAIVTESLSFLESRVQDIAAKYNQSNLKTVALGSGLGCLTGDLPASLSVYNDGATYSSDILKILPTSRTEQPKQEEREEMSLINSDHSCASSMVSSISDTDSGLVPYTGGPNGALDIPCSQQTHVQIQKVTNLYQQQCIMDDGTDYLLERTNVEMKKEVCYFDISKTKAWKSFLSTDKIAIVVGFSESFKGMFCKAFYQKYTSCCDVFRLNGHEDWKICYKRPQPFAIFMKEAFGPFGTKSEGISHLIYELTNLENLEAALFTMDTLAFKRNKEDLKRRLGTRLADYVINLDEEEHLLSEVEKREILKKTFELVNDQGRSLRKQDNDGMICYESFIEDILGMAENPIFFDSCEEFIVFSRHDENVLQLFSLPLDGLVDKIRCLREKWPDGYYVLRLVAFLEVFNQSEQDGELASILKQAIHGNLIQILNQLESVYLEVQNNKVRTRNFVFRHRMMQYAVLCTESDKPFLIQHCPIGFLVEVVTRMTNLRCISFKDEYCSIAKRFIQEILQGQQAATLVFHEIWISEEFLKDFKEEWKTVEKQYIDSNLTSPYESNFLYLVVFTKSSELLRVILKTCKEHNLKLSLSLLKKAIYAACVIGHFNHFELLMQRIDVDKFCQSVLETDILKPRRDTVNSKFVFDKLKCLPSIIHTAVAFNRLDILDYLKSCGQNVNYKDSRDYTSLHVACRHGSNIEILEYLKANNGNASMVDKSGNTCLHAACCCYDNIEIVTSLVKDFPKLVLKRNTSDQAPLHTAVGAGNTQIVELLIEISNKFQKNCLLDRDYSGCTVLHLACKVPKNLHMVRFLVERQPSLITIQDHYGNTALHTACQTQGNTAVAEYLVSKGMDINIVNASIRTPLHEACRADNVEVSEFLLQKEGILISQDKNNKYPYQLTKNQLLRGKFANKNERNAASEQ